MVFKVSSPLQDYQLHYLQITRHMVHTKDLVILEIGGTRKSPGGTGIFEYISL